jgi:hypothetical protein
MGDRKMMSVKEFCDLGLLQEVNRQVLHPLGVALSVFVDEDGNESFSDIWDCRDDPEGIAFGDQNLEPKAFKVDQEMRARYGKRMDRLGFMVQPAGDYTGKFPGREGPD